MKNLFNGKLVTAILLLTLVPAISVAGTGIWTIYGGLNMANMGGDIDQFGEELEAELEYETGQAWTVDKTAQKGVIFGFGMTKPTSPTMSIQYDVLYVNRGVNFDMTTAGGSAEAGFKLAYVEVPLMLRFSPSPEASVQPIFLIGASAAIKLSADLEVSALGDSQSVDFSEFFKSTAFGLIGGAGVRFSVGEKNGLLIQARYHMGMSNLFDDSSVDSKANDLMFMAGFELGG